MSWMVLLTFVRPPSRSTLLGCFHESAGVCSYLTQQHEHLFGASCHSSQLNEAGNRDAPEMYATHGHLLDSLCYLFHHDDLPTPSSLPYTPAFTQYSQSFELDVLVPDISQHHFGARSASRPTLSTLSITLLTSSGACQSSYLHSRDAVTGWHKGSAYIAGRLHLVGDKVTYSVLPKQRLTTSQLTALSDNSAYTVLRPHRIGDIQAGV